MAPLRTIHFVRILKLSDPHRLWAATQFTDVGMSSTDDHV